MGGSPSEAKAAEEETKQRDTGAFEKNEAMDGSAASSLGSRSASRSFSAFAGMIVSGKQAPPRGSDATEDDEAISKKKRRLCSTQRRPLVFFSSPSPLQRNRSRVRTLMPRRKVQQTRSSYWFKGTITMRSVGKKDKQVLFGTGDDATAARIKRTSPSTQRKKMAKEPSEYVVGTGTTYSPLPDHIENDDFDIPDCDCSQLGDLAPVGKGSQAIVYRAELQNMWMAVKVLRPQLAQQPAELAAFQRECNLLARLTHPNVNNVIGVGTYQGSPCAVLEWCALDVAKALRLSEVHDKQVRREVRAEYAAPSRLSLVTQLAHALKFLHSGHALPRCYVLHRDLKPENLGLAGSHATLDASVAASDSAKDGGGLTGTHTLKLLDFGLAVCVEVTGSAGDDTAVAPSTQQKRAAPEDCVYDLTSETGTCRYMAPEVALGRKYGPKADVYSFAVVSWEMLVLGGKPYIGMNTEELHWRVAFEGQRPNIPPEWHPDLRSLFARAWDANPRARPTFAEIYAEMQRFEQMANSPENPADVLGERLSSQGVCC